MKEITDKDIYDAAEYYLQQWFETNDYDNVNRYPSEIDTELKDAFIAGVMWLIDNADEEPNKNQTMYRTCIKEFSLNGALFVPGGEYNIEYNPITKSVIIEHPLAGTMELPNSIIKENFL